MTDLQKEKISALRSQGYGYASKQSRRARIEAFLRALEKAELVEKFETGLWCGLVDYATVYAKNDVRFTFKNGQEIRA